MIIYNETLSIDDSIHDEWLVWIKEHIPQVLATGKFEKATLTKVLVDEEMEEPNLFYSIPLVFARSFRRLLS